MDIKMFTILAAVFITVLLGLGVILENFLNFVSYVVDTLRGRKEEQELKELVEKCKRELFSKFEIIDLKPGAYCSYRMKFKFHKTGKVYDMFYIPFDDLDVNENSLNGEIKNAFTAQELYWISEKVSVMIEEQKGQEDYDIAQENERLCNEVRIENIED